MNRRSIVKMVWLLVALCVLAACGPTASSEPSLTTDTQSTTFATDAEKIAFLQRYMTFPSNVIDTEFHVVYHDNSGGIAPGPSDWTIEAIMKVAPDEMGVWSDDTQPADAATVDLQWADGLLARSGWIVSGPPRVITRSGEVIVLYDVDGIVARKMTTLE